MTGRVSDTFPAAGDHASRPADPGTIPGFYSCTTHNLIYRWDGSAWSTWATLGGTGVVETIVAGTNVTVDSTDPANPVVSASGGGGGVTVARAQRTAGDITLSGSTPAVVTTDVDLTIAASIGDWLEVGISGLWNAASNLGYFAALGLGVIVSGSLVRYTNSGTTTFNNGNRAWFAPAATTDANGGLFPASGGAIYQVQSGDIDTGNVLLRLYGYVGSSGSRVLRAASTDPLEMWVKNLGAG
jgi:hypothetical protein